MKLKGQISEERQRAAAARASRTSPSATTSTPADIARQKTAAAIAQRIRQPWPDRLATLRRAHGEGVLLVSLDLGNSSTGAKDGGDVLVGRASDLLTVINYVNRLKATAEVAEA